MAVLGEHRLGVELHTLDAQFTVTQTHHDAVRRPGRHFQLLRYGGRLGGQRVVARRRERRRQTRENALAPVLDRRGLPVQQLGGAVHDTAVGHLHGLHAEADTEDGHPGRRTVPHHLHTDPRLLRSAGPRGQQHTVEPVLGMRRRHLVVAQDLALGAQLVQVLNQVEDEAVVVVDDENARAHWLSTVTSLKGSSGSAQGKTYWKRT
ncbi:hypothetical protein SHIRM173S_04541 [Streptomyces hirsutus]